MITVDDREAQQHPEIPDELDISVVIQRLEAGDFAFLDRDSRPLGIERCEVGNFVQKLRSGELEEQMYKCQANYTSIILLIEGVYDQVDGLLSTHRAGNRGYFRTHVYPHTYFDYAEAAMIRMSEMGIEVLWSPNFKGSMSVVKILYDQRTSPLEDSTLFKRIRTPKIPVKMSSNPAVPKLLCLVPRLPEKTAIRLINKYGSIWTILHAEESELLEVEGVGKGTIVRLKEGVGKC